ncbi:outer membrane beta-barrel protein [Pontibacter sp. E15-1]|uniref:outer membrane beta-barrel protein n=1 Tax=Pontibacter sp. E15-1 TaxID=2919918 RepID=UPI001F4F39F0|nr:outer membrane beta-barrel protein [Pontibacter sp. E15-1]MCJ8166993.1 outer membrane beta-barrel protein [Pontibacter sp. E15-1]
MSSAANHQRGKLEDEFKNRMHDAEATPSQDLWARIDHHLTVQESSQYKKRMVFYRQLAAACIALLVLAGGAGAYYFSRAPQGGPQLATTPAPHANTRSSSERAEATLPAHTPPVHTPAAIAATPEQATAASGPQTRNRTAAGTAAPGTAAATRHEVVALAPVASETVSPSSRFRMDAVSEPSGLGNTARASFQRHTSIQRTMEALAERAAFNAGTFYRQAGSSSIPVAAQRADAEFRQQSEVVLARARQQDEAQPAVAYTDEALGGIKKSKKEKRDEKSRWSVGMAYAPSYFEQNIGAPNQAMAMSSRQSLMPSVASAADMSAMYMDEARQEYDASTDPGFSYGVEAKTGFKLGKKLKLLAGLGFLQNTARSKASYVVQPSQRNMPFGMNAFSAPATVFLPALSAGPATDSLVVAKRPTYDVEYRYRHLTVPVGLQYEGNIGNDWFWYGGAGVAANILLQSSIISAASDVQSLEYDRNEPSPFRKLQWSGNMSAGVGKRLAGNMSVTLGPEVRSYFTTMLADPGSTQASHGKPYTVGMNMAVNYELGGGKRSR